MENKKELWDLYTAREEYNAPIKDKYKRNTYWSSKNRDIFTPTVSNFLINNGLEPHYPDNKQFALCLTHDIDHLFDPEIPLKQHIKNGVKKLLTLKLKELKKTVDAAAKRQINPKFHISETLKHEKKYNARSSFYFLSLSPGEQDFNYDPAEISSIFGEILQNKGEIGLHGGHNAYNNSAKIKLEKEKLEAAAGTIVQGYRNHYLRFETPTTWEYLDELDFKYDTTFGYADCVGFRNGMCHPFQPYSRNKNCFLDILELPLIIMEGTLWGTYMRISEQDQFELCKKLIDTVADNKGVVTLLWHNTAMQGFEGQLYSSILKYAYEKGAWMTTGNEIADFWKENNLHLKTNTILEQLKNA